jgi:hypothetical protein
MTVLVNDPWSFVDEQGTGTFIAKVRATDGNLLLLRFAGQHYVATPRQGGSFSLIPVTEEQSRQAPPWGRDEWRGLPVALLADLRDA